MTAKLADVFGEVSSVWWGVFKGACLYSRDVGWFDITRSGVRFYGWLGWLYWWRVEDVSGRQWPSG